MSDLTSNSRNQSVKKNKFKMFFKNILNFTQYYYKKNKRFTLVLATLVTILISYFLVMNNLGGFRFLSIDRINVPPLSKSEKQLLRKYNNRYHLNVAQSKGIKGTVKSKEEFKKNLNFYLKKYDLEELESNKYFTIQRLSHSVPYLQADVHWFLDELGSRFREKLKTMGVAHHKFYITSVLRTEKDQKKLTIVNVNATRNESSHLYGRTIDISKTQFFNTSENEIIYSSNLGIVLLRELLNMQREGKCYVLLENRNHCLHITIR